MFLLVILPATGAQLSGPTAIAGDDFGAGIVWALEIAALAQCGMLAGAVAARTLWPVSRLIRFSLRLSPSRLDKTARRSVCVGILAVIAFSVMGGASLRSFFVYATSGGYGTFSPESTGNLACLTAVEGIAGLALDCRRRSPTLAVAHAPASSESLGPQKMPRWVVAP